MVQVKRAAARRILLDTLSGAGYDPVLPTPVRMQLLVAVINHEENLDDVLAGFVELGITGATVVSSEGMGHVLSHDVPIFAGLRSLTKRSRPSNQTVFSVVADDKVDAAMIGSAAFLLPDGRIEPARRAPPSTWNCTAAMRPLGW